tara:strand:+ start:924 stop:1199 length:276 start_codon:yes stop_codon:yes gene_type:complete
MTTTFMLHTYEPGGTIPPELHAKHIVDMSTFTGHNAPMDVFADWLIQEGIEPTKGWLRIRGPMMPWVDDLPVEWNGTDIMVLTDDPQFYMG